MMKNLHVCSVKNLCTALFFFALYLGFSPQFANAGVNDFKQSSVLIGNSQISPAVLTLLPDPDVDLTSIISYQTFLEDFHGGSDNPSVLTHLIRHLEAAGSLSETLLSYTNQNGDPMITIPMAADSNSVLLATPGGENEIKFITAPESDYVFPAGTPPQVLEFNLNNISSVSLTNQYFIENLLQAGVTGEIPFFKFFFSAPFPKLEDEAGVVLVSEIPVDESHPEGDRMVAYFVVGMSNGTPKLFTSGPISTGLNVGSPEENSHKNAASETPLLADFDNDGCQDLVILVDGTPSGHDNYMITMKGNCDGTFGAALPHLLGSSEGSLVFGLTSGDFDGDGNVELVYSKGAVQDGAAQGQIVFVASPLEAFNTVSTINRNSVLPTFIHNLDCNVDGFPDLVSAEIVVIIDPTKDHNDTTIKPSGVYCYLNDGKGNFNSSEALFSTEDLNKLINQQMPGNNTDTVIGLILQSQVGPVGCGGGWYGSMIFTSPETAQERNFTGYTEVLMAEHADCAAVASALGKLSGTISDIQGGASCMMSSKQTSKSAFVGFVFLLGIFLLLRKNIFKSKFMLR